MIPLADAQARISANIKCGPQTSVGLGDAAGLFVVDDVRSAINVPPFTSVAMDGFAVLAVDTAGATAYNPVELRVLETIAAGGIGQSRPLKPGQAIKVMTGAPLPDGADAVIMVELTEQHLGSVKILEQVEPGNHLRRLAGDVESGDVVLAARTCIGPAQQALLTSVGVAEVEVVTRPRVGVLSTGDELVSPPAQLGPAQIFDSNRPMLLSLVAAAGCTAVDLGHVADDEEAVLSNFTEGAATCDALISTGGVSMGDYDPVRAVLSELGDISWMQVAIKPAKPLSFGVLEQTPIFGLPGNPVSAAVSFELFARPNLRVMMGDPKPYRRTIAAIADEPLRRRSDGKVHFVRVVASFQADGAIHVRSAGGQGSHQLSALAAANALAVLSDGAEVSTGERVNIMLTDSSVFSAALSMP